MINCIFEEEGLLNMVICCRDPFRIKSTNKQELCISDHQLSKQGKKSFDGKEVSATSDISVVISRSNYDMLQCDHE
jgi:hypothetical protein